MQVNARRWAAQGVSGCPVVSGGAPLHLFFGDFTRDTLGLTDAEIGSYFLLIGAMFSAGGRLSPDPAFLRRVARCHPSRWEKRWAVLQPYFTYDGHGFLTHGRIERDLKRIEERREQAAEAGRLGGLAKAGRKPNGGGYR